MQLSRFRLRTLMIAVGMVAGWLTLLHKDPSSAAWVIVIAAVLGPPTILAVGLTEVCGRTPTMIDRLDVFVESFGVSLWLGFALVALFSVFFVYSP